MIDYADISISSTNFTNCSSTASGAYGGAVYWYRNSAPSGGPFFRSCRFCTNRATNGPDFMITAGDSPDNPFDSDCVTYNEKEITCGYYSSGYKEASGWLSRMGDTCPSDSGGRGEGEEEDDIDDVTIDECSSDDGDPTPGKTLYVSTDGAETSNCGKNRESDPLGIHGMIVVFVTDIFWQLSIRSSSTVMILSIVLV